MAQIVGKCKHQVAGQCIRPAILNVSFSYCSANISVLIQQVVDRERKFAPLIFK